MLPVQVSPAFLTQIFQAIESDPKTELLVDLPSQTVTIVTTGAVESFDINAYKKENLQNGYDDIDYLVSMQDEIKTFASQRPF